jgi:hypothetical protein
MEQFTDTPADTSNGQQVKEAKTLRVTMPNGRAYSMPADVAAAMLEAWARTNRKAFIQAHANAVMGEET